MKKKKTRKMTKKREKKKGGKKENRAQRVFLINTPRWAPKLIFHISTVKRNRNEIEAQKNSDFEHPTKKMKENERK